MEALAPALNIQHPLVGTRTHSHTHTRTLLLHKQLSLFTQTIVNCFCCCCDGLGDKSATYIDIIIVVSYRLSMRVFVCLVWVFCLFAGLRGMLCVVVAVVFDVLKNANIRHGLNDPICVCSYFPFNACLAGSIILE